MWQLEEFQKLFRQLRTSGLPLAYCTDAVDELITHREGALEKGRTSSLGDVDQLARRYVEAYRQSTLLRRCPRLILFCLGLVATAVMWVAGSALGIGAFCLLNYAALESHHISVSLIEWANLTSRICECLPLIFAGIVMRHFAVQSGAGWSAYATALFWPFLFALASQIALDLSPIVGQSQFSMGLSFSSSILPNLGYVLLMAMVLMLVTLRIRSRDRKFHDGMLVQ